MDTKPQQWSCDNLEGSTIQNEGENITLLLRRPGPASPEIIANPYEADREDEEFLHPNCSDERLENITPATGKGVVGDE